MFPETTIFAVLVVLAIVVTLIFLLVRKPHFRFRLTRVGATEREQKSSHEHELIQTSKTHPPRFRHIDESFEEASIPHTQLGSAKPTESPADLESPPKILRREVSPEIPTSIDRTATAPEKPPEPAEASQIIEEKPAPIRPARPQLRPSNCTHFFGYLRKIPKNSPMPDECFGCPRMVECLYYNITPE